MEPVSSTLQAITNFAISELFLLNLVSIIKSRLILYYIMYPYESRICIK